MGSSPWGRKESDTPEPLSAHTYTHTGNEDPMSWGGQNKLKKKGVRPGLG